MITLLYALAKATAPSATTPCPCLLRGGPRWFGATEKWADSPWTASRHELEWMQQQAPTPPKHGTSLSRLASASAVGCPDSVPNTASRTTRVPRSGTMTQIVAAKEKGNARRSCHFRWSCGRLGRRDQVLSSVGCAAPDGHLPHLRNRMQPRPCPAHHARETSCGAFNFSGLGHPRPPLLPPDLLRSCIASRSVSFSIFPALCAPLRRSPLCLAVRLLWLPRCGLDKAWVVTASLLRVALSQRLIREKPPTHFFGLEWELSRGSLGQLFVCVDVGLMVSNQR